MSTIYDRAVRALYPMLGGRKALGETIASPTPEGGTSYYCGGPERRCSHLTCAVVSTIAEADLLNYGPAAVTCSCCNGDPDTVCAACGQHSCWAGVMYCEDYKTAGTRQKPSGGAS